MKANQIEIDFYYSDNKYLKCNTCGKFISIEQVAKSEFTPDTEFSKESTEFICKKCYNSNKRVNK